MRRILAALVAALLIFALAAPTAVAATADETDVVVTITDPVEKNQSETEAETEDPEQAEPNDAKPEKILTPESPFYFLKRFVESVKLFLTFDGEKKAQLLSELAEERARELEALQEKFADGQLSEKQFKLLEKALEDLILFTEKLANTLAENEEDPAPSDQEQGDTAPEEAQEPDAEDEEADTEEDEEATDPEENEDVEPQEEVEDEEVKENDKTDNEKVYPDKYLKRVAHLQAIAKKAPESAQKGLARAIANALRQRERAIAKGKIPCDQDDEAEDQETYQPIKKESPCKVKTWKKAEKDKQKLDKKFKSDHAKDKDWQWPAKSSPGKGKGKTKGK